MVFSSLLNPSYNGHNYLAERGSFIIKKWLWVLLSGIVLAVVIVVAVVFITRPAKPVKLTPAQFQALQYTVPSLTTNLSDSSMIQTTIVLQAKNQLTLNTLNNSSAQINNDVISVLNDTSGTTIDAPNGLLVLKQRLLNALSPFGRIDNVYFTQLIVQ